MTPNLFDPWLAAWRLVPDGAAFQTHSSHLLPVRRGDIFAMLKVAVSAEEARGGEVMVWYEGVGAAKVYAADKTAILLERCGGDLADWPRQGRDDAATKIICETVRQLHTPRTNTHPPTIVPLQTWFRALEPAASRHGGVFKVSLSLARKLFAAPNDVAVLHGDIHHRNILDGGMRGWLAIDPKGLLGERGFDYANLFCNPDETIAKQPGRLQRQARIVAEQAGLDFERLKMWVAAYAGLSAAWNLEDGQSPAAALAVAEIAAAALAL